MSSKHHILFDLDGTLTDSFKGIVHSVQYALSRYGIVENDLHKLTPFIHRRTRRYDITVNIFPRKVGARTQPIPVSRRC